MILNILLALTLLVSILVSGAAGIIAWKAAQKNFELQDKHKEYNRAHTMILDMLEQDTEFMKTEIIRRFSMDLPETKAVNSSIIKFQNDLVSIRQALREYKMLEE